MNALDGVLFAFQRRTDPFPGGGANLHLCFVFGAQVIPGRDRRAVEALCWVGRRLFSAGLDGEITEYDLENLRPQYSLEAYGGPVWSLSSNRQGTMLAVCGSNLRSEFKEFPAAVS